MKMRKLGTQGLMVSEMGWAVWGWTMVMASLWIAKR